MSSGRLNSAAVWYCEKFNLFSKMCESHRHKRIPRRVLEDEEVDEGARQQQNDMDEGQAVEQIASFQSLKRFIV